MAPDVNLFEKEMGWKGIVQGGNKANASHGPRGCGSVPTTPLSLPPQPTLGLPQLWLLWPLTCWAFGSACPSELHARMWIEVRQPQGRPWAARLPQGQQGMAEWLQESGLGAATKLHE